MIKEKEKCPTCANDLISETRIVLECFAIDMGLFQHEWYYTECITCMKQWTFSEKEIRVKVGRR